MKKIIWIKKNAISMLVLSTLALSSTSSFAKEYYKWTDSKGSTHYTTSPPPKNAKKHGKIDTYGQTASTQHTAASNSANSSTEVASSQNNTVQSQQQPVNFVQQNQAPRPEVNTAQQPRTSDPQQSTVVNK